MVQAWVVFFPDNLIQLELHCSSFVMWEAAILIEWLSPAILFVPYAADRNGVSAIGVQHTSCNTTLLVSSIDTLLTYLQVNFSLLFTSQDTIACMCNIQLSLQGKLSACFLNCVVWSGDRHHNIAKIIRQHPEQTYISFLMSHYTVIWRLVSKIKFNYIQQEPKLQWVYYAQESFTIDTARLWNRAPLAIMNATSLQIAKNCIKRHCKEMPI